MKRLVNWFYGVGSALELFPKSRDYRINRHGFATDTAKLRGDFGALGRDLRKQLKHESADYRSR